jgi:hypothetical protein
LARRANHLNKGYSPAQRIQHRFRAAGWHLNARQASDDKYGSDQPELDQGRAMNIEHIFRRNVLKLALLSAFSLCGVLNASATDTYMYRDIKQPNGFPRDAAAKQADFAACGIAPEGVPASALPKYNRCLRAHGWAFDHIVKDPAGGFTGDRPGEGIYTYNDASRSKGHARSNDQEQADTAACDGGDTRTIGTSGFNACMRSRGWSFAHFTPKAHDDDQDKRNEDASNDAERQRDDQMRNDDFVRNLNSQQ